MPIYCSTPTIFKVPIPAATIKESVATGPIESCLEVPIRMYIICGVNAA